MCAAKSFMTAGALHARRACKAPAVMKLLAAHIPHASPDYHALRYHNGAHDEGGQMPPIALSFENYMVLWFILALAVKNLAALTLVPEIELHVAAGHATAVP